MFGVQNGWLHRQTKRVLLWLDVFFGNRFPEYEEDKATFARKAWVHF